jgi:hypothetical protein
MIPLDQENLDEWCTVRAASSSQHVGQSVGKGRVLPEEVLLPCRVKEAYVRREPQLAGEEWHWHLLGHCCHHPNPSLCQEISVSSTWQHPSCVSYKSAGVLRHSLLSRAGPHSPGNSDEVVGSDPVLVAQVVMLENANKVLEGSVSSLRSDMQENIAPLLYRIAMLEEEKRIVKDEMNTKLRCRETTISNLENSLSQYRALQQAKKNRLKKKGGKNDDEK